MYTSNAIEIIKLTKYFDSISAVNEFNLTINQGEIFGIVGPDGAGKTTTFRMLCGILAPTSGPATILGFDLIKDSKKINKEIGTLEQLYVTYLIPLRYYIDIIRGIFLKGVGIAELWQRALALLVFGIVILTLSVWRFRKRLS